MRLISSIWKPAVRALSSPLIDHLDRTTTEGGVREQATTIGLEIAERVFQLHGMDVAGHVLFRKRLAIRAGAWQR